MAKSKNRMNNEVNASSMADIAFLLLVFFLLTTTIRSDRGLTLLLPPKPDDIQNIDIKIQERNLFKILVNSQDKLLVENEPLTDISRIRSMVKEFVLNNGQDPESSDSPEEAIVSFRTDRGTSYDVYINILDEVQAAYYEIYAERVGISAEEFRRIADKQETPKEKEMYEKARDGIPMNISIAEPQSIGG
jgi:biopolymer transport protein ExbD